MNYGGKPTCRFPIHIVRFVHGAGDGSAEHPAPFQGLMKRRIPARAEMVDGSRMHAFERLDKRDEP
jgi:hypothetical protein